MLMNLSLDLNDDNDKNDTRAKIESFIKDKIMDDRQQIETEWRQQWVSCYHFQILSIQT